MTVILSVARGAHVLALVSLFGTLVSLVMVAPATLREAGPSGVPVRHRLIVLARWSAGVSFVLGIIWMTFQAASIAGAATFYSMLTAVRPVTLHTQFGHLMLLRCGLLVAAQGSLATGRVGVVIALLLSGAALILQGFISHAGAVGGGQGSQLLASEALHLLAAGGWLGGLAPLFLMIDALPSRSATEACYAFSLVGAIAVALIAGTALEQSTQWIGGLGGLFGTTYGHIALLKLMLFFVLLILAALNRFALTARLLGAGAASARQLLRLSIATEAILGTLVIMVAAFLASATPATHVQPEWPFSWRPSLEVLADPESWNLFYGPLALVACGTALIGVGCLWRRMRWRSLALAMILLVPAGLRMASLLAVEAYPTSFVTSPTEFAVGSIARGAELFVVNCANCHGTNGQGDGPAAATLLVRPADLTAPHLLAHSDGDLFWFIANGVDAPSGQPAMPAFSGAISSDGLWALVDFLHAHHAGMTRRKGGSSEELVTVPQFDAICPDGTTVNLDDLRGHIIRIVAMPDEAPPPPALPSVEGVDTRTILLARHPPMRPLTSACTTVEPEAWTAFAILLGITADKLSGTEILADKDLWLRAVSTPGNAGTWNDPRSVTETIRDILAHPISRSSGAGHAHHH